MRAFIAHDRVRDRYGMLLAAVVVTYIVSVMGGDSPVGLSVLCCIQLTTVWLALRVAAAQQLARIAGFAVAGLCVAVVLSLVFSEFAGKLNTLNASVFLVSTLLYLTAPIAIVRHIVRRRDLDMEALLGVISAYLLIGLFFAFSFRLISVWQPGPFFGDVAGDGTLADDLFFSFSTLTTVGYGNLVPATNPGQTFAMFEAMIGQLFLVIVVAKVVTGLSGNRKATDAPESTDSTDAAGDSDPAAPATGDSHG